MKNKWKILCGIVTMSTILASTGCVNIRQDLKEAREAVEEATGTTIGSDENENDSYLDILSGGQLLEFGDSDEDADVYTGPADLAIINELPDILRSSDLPRMDHYSDDTEVAVDYFNPEISGYFSIVCRSDRTEVFYNYENNMMSFDFYKPSGTYFSYSVRGETRDNIGVPVIYGDDIRMDGIDFAEYSKDFYKNSDDYTFYYGEYDLPEELGTCQDNLYTIFARFGILSNEAFDELGLSWEDFGINFGEEYKKYDAYATLKGTDEKVPIFLEKQTFTNGVSDTTGKTWVETVRDGIKEQAIYHAREDEKPTDWFAYNEVDSNNFVNGSDYVQIETYSESDSFMVYYHSSGYEEDRYASRVFYLNFYDDGENNVSVRYMYQTDYKGTDTPGVVSSDTNMGFGVYCKSEEMKDIFASTESLKAYLEAQDPNSLYEESDYMTYDEMLEEFMTNYTRYMGSIDDNIKTMGTCLADYGIEY